MFWALALIGAACCIPSSLISLLRDFKNAPTMTLMSPKKYADYPFPLIRFCPRSWVNASRLERVNLTHDGFLYALSLLNSIQLNTGVPNVTKAKRDLDIFLNQTKLGLSEFYYKMAYDIDELFDCFGCKNQTMALTVLGVCYDFQFRKYIPSDISDQNVNYNFIYYPPFENYTDPANPNSMYNSSYVAHVLYINVHPRDFFGFDPFFLNSNTSYTVDIKPSVSVRLPNMGRRKCLSEEKMKKKDYSFEMCQSDCREWLYGVRCWGYMHYGLSFAHKDGPKPLQWLSSLHGHEGALEDTCACETKLLDELMTCMNRCYSECRQWQYDVSMTESSHNWNLAPAPNPNITYMTVADFFVRYRDGGTSRKGYEGDNVTHVTFQYFVQHGVILTEEESRKSLSMAVSNVGGMMGLVAGASALSLWQLLECVIRLCFKHLNWCTHESYNLAVRRLTSAGLEQR